MAMNLGRTIACGACFGGSPFVQFAGGMASLSLQDKDSTLGKLVATVTVVTL